MKKKNNDISLGHRHYWTDTQGHAHKVVFDEVQAEKPKATFIVLGIVVLLTIAVGAAMIVTTRSSTDSQFFVQPQDPPTGFSRVHTLPANAETRVSALAAGWNDEFFIADEEKIELFDPDGDRLDGWKTNETERPTALKFVADEKSVYNGLLLVGYPHKVTALRFSLDQYLPSETDETRGGIELNAEGALEANAVRRTANRGAQGEFKDLLTLSDAEIAGLECVGDRLFIGDMRAGRVKRFSLEKLLEHQGVSEDPNPDCEIGAPDDLRGYPGLKPTFSKHFCMSYLADRALLFVANSGLFRIDAFDVGTGVWSATESWAAGPGHVFAFHGAANPISIVATSDRFLVAENGAFYDPDKTSRITPLSFYSSSGDRLELIGDGSEFEDEETVVSIHLSETGSYFYLLRSTGAVDVWKKQS